MDMWWGLQDKSDCIIYTRALKIPQCSLQNWAVNKIGPQVLN